MQFVCIIFSYWIREVCIKFSDGVRFSRLRRHTRISTRIAQGSSVLHLVRRMILYIGDRMRKYLICLKAIVSKIIRGGCLCDQATAKCFVRRDQCIWSSSPFPKMWGQGQGGCTYAVLSIVRSTAVRVRSLLHSQSDWADAEKALNPA